MNDKLTDQAAKNVLVLKKFGSGNNEEAKKNIKSLKTTVMILQNQS